LRCATNAAGIDAATSLRIFWLFYIAKSVGKGASLGWSEVHGSVHGHKGALTVESHAGEGAIFTIYLLRACTQIGVSALDATTPVSVDLVAANYKFPGMSGLVVMRHLCMIRADVLAAVISGFVD
jgi:hypothetical protein